MKRLSPIIIAIGLLGFALTTEAALQITSSPSVPANGVVMGSGGTVAQVVASSLVGGVGEKVAQTAVQTGKAHIFTVPAGQFWTVSFFAFKVNAGKLGASNLKIVRYDQGFTSNSTYATVLAEHDYAGAEITTTNNHYLYYEFDPITLAGGVKGTTYGLDFTNDIVSADLSAYMNLANAYPDGSIGRGIFPAITLGLTRDFNFAMGNTFGSTPATTLFEADFDTSTPVSGSVTANASAAVLNAGTAVGTWTIPGVNPGAVIANSGATNNAFVFDRALSGNTTNNSASAVFTRSVDLAGGEALTLEMDLYAVRQANNQRVDFTLEDADGNVGYSFSFRMNNTKDCFTTNASGQVSNLSANGTGVNNGFLNPTLNAYQSWGATMLHVKLDVSSQPTQAGNRGAWLSIDWNGDGDFLDSGELVSVTSGPRSSGVSEISSLRLLNNSSVAGGAWVDNIVATAYPGSVLAKGDVFDLAKFQATNSDGESTNNPKQFVNDGFLGQDNRWVSNSADPHWMEITLATPTTIGSAHLYSGALDGFAMANATLQYWNGNAWIAIPGGSVSSNTATDLNMTFDAPVTAQAFRLDTTDAVARVREIALYPPTTDGAIVPFGTDLDLNIAKLRQNAATSISGTNYPKLAIDGYVDDASSWLSSTGTQDLEITLPQAENVRGIHLYSGLNGQPGTQMQDFEIAYWDTTTSAYITFSGGSVTGNTRLERSVRFTAPAQTTKIRLRSLDVGTARVRELVVLPENFGSGYPLWTDATQDAPPPQTFTEYDDAFYTIENRAAALNLATSVTSSQLTNSTGAWFQILLNLGTDTYRLRSVATGACFEVANASTSAGAAIVEGNYSSMPHQRWQLLDTGDGVHFRIVNVWSGLVLDTVASGITNGTGVVQSVSSASQTQHWSFIFQDDYPKRGQAAFLHFNFMYRSSWLYNWGNDAEGTFDYGQYMPMQWGSINSATPALLRLQPTLYGRANQTTVLGFNEPDLPDQSNITELNAAAMWPRLERMRMPLGGPVPAARNGSWRQAYEALATEQGLRSDYMTVHWYDSCNNGNPSNIISHLQNLYNVYQKPLWLTEFSTIDFSGTQTSWSRNDNYNWLAEFMWRAESLPWLKKYSVFEWGTEDNNADPTVNDSPKLALHKSNDQTNPGYEDLSECGRMYAGWDGDTTIRNAKTYIIHNKATCLRLRAEAGASLDKADILSNDGPMQWTFSSTPSSRKYITCLTDGRRLSYDGSTLSLASATATGTAVEWQLDSYQYGWFYIRHVGTTNRLRITNAGVLDMGASAEATDNTRWRFIHIGGATKPTTPNSLIGQWSLNSTDGNTALDSSSHAFDGQVISPPTWARSPAGRDYLAFNGTDQHVRIESLPDLTNGFTIGVWARSNTATWNSNGMLASRRAQFVLHPNAGGKGISMTVFQPGNVSKSVTFGAAAIDGFDLTEWHHYAGSYSADTGLISLYIDGILRATNQLTPGPLQSDDAGFLLLGRDDGFSNRYFDGALDEVTLHNYALSDPQLVAQATGFDDDQDGLEDSFERQIIEASNTDTIQTLAHVQPLDDFDNDGSTNLLEWCLATDATQQDSPIQQVASDGTYFSMTYTRRLNSGATIQCKWSPTITATSWQTIGVTETILSTNGDIQTIQAQVLADEDRKFLRVEVTQP